VLTYVCPLLLPDQPEANQAHVPDTRENKVDLGVGVYKDEAGATPVMTAIKKAEKQLLDTQDTKSYVGPIGSRPFCSAMVSQVFGKDADTDRIRCAQSAGGSGALRILSDLLRKIRPTAKVWVSDPTWPNHVPLLTAAGFELERYQYYDRSTNSITFDQMISTLSAAPENDIVLLHGCCHNPTGADLNMDQWKAVADVCEKRSLFPFVDFAYQGFGDGLEEDAQAIRYLASRVPEMVVAASCSKNLGLYRERAGAAMVLAENAENADRALGMLGGVIRSNYSMPPDHGANISNIVLTDAALNAEWQNELDAMRNRMIGLRADFAHRTKRHVQQTATQHRANRNLATRPWYLYRWRWPNQHRRSTRRCTRRTCWNDYFRIGVSNSLLSSLV